MAYHTVETKARKESRFKGHQKTVTPKLGKVARKSGTKASKTKNSDVLGAQFKLIELLSSHCVGSGRRKITEGNKQCQVANQR